MLSAETVAHILQMGFVHKMRLSRFSDFRLVHPHESYVSLAFRSAGSLFLSNNRLEFWLCPKMWTFCWTTAKIQRFLPISSKLQMTADSWQETIKSFIGRICIPLFCGQQGAKLWIYIQTQIETRNHRRACIELLHQRETIERLPLPSAGWILISFWPWFSFRRPSLQSINNLLLVLRMGITPKKHLQQMRVKNSKLVFELTSGKILADLRIFSWMLSQNFLTWMFSTSTRIFLLLYFAQRSPSNLLEAQGSKPIESLFSAVPIKFLTKLLFSLLCVELSSDARMRRGLGWWMKAG